MAEVSFEVFEQLWYYKRRSTWNALINALNKVLDREIISQNEFEDIKYAINKMIQFGSKFPNSPSELQVQLDHFM